MIPPSTAWKLVRDLGPGWALRRLRIEAELRLGIVERRLPVSDWNFTVGNASDNETRVGDPLRSELLRSKFFFSPQQLPKPVCSAQVCRDADRVLAGEWPYFSHSWFQIGFPPDWHLNVLDGSRADDARHWSRTAGYRGQVTGDRDGSDIKFVWEPSRFSVVYLLVRAYAASADERYAEAFWTLVEDWAEVNRPNCGVNWASGQEAAFRVMAWCFGLFGFLNASCSTSERVFRLARMIDVHGDRIAGFIEYALSQRNNHGISEAVGLFTIGVLFPHLARAAEWTRMGQLLIVSQLREQVYEDGSYIQHSFNYERVLIDLLIWALRLGEIHEVRFAAECYEALDPCLAFMVRFCHLRSGRIPNYGANDGTLLLPLTNCDYTDFRPSIDAAHQLLHGKPLLREGPWSELSAWLLGRPLSDRAAADSSIPALRYIRASQPTASSGPPKRLPPSGYLNLIANESNGMLRAGRYEDRPSQADQLHFDLWWRGQNVACDAGSYLYNAGPLWANALAGTAVHNTVTIAGRDQMTPAGRFLWLDSAQASSENYSIGTQAQAVTAYHNGYRRLGATHRRSILCFQEADLWIVVDDVTGSYSGEVQLHWLFPDVPFRFDLDPIRLLLQFPEGDFNCAIIADHPFSTSLARAGQLISGADDLSVCDKEIRGWRSLYYGSKDPALSLGARAAAALPMRFVTLFHPAEVSVEQFSPTCVAFQAAGTTYAVGLQAIGTPKIFTTVHQA